LRAVPARIARADSRLAENQVDLGSSAAQHGWVRKQLLGALVATVLFVLIGAACAVVLGQPGSPRESGVLADSQRGRSGAARGPSVRSVSVPLAGRLARTAAGRSATRTLHVDRFAQVAVVWHGPTVPHAEVRIRHAGRWSGWKSLEPIADLDAGEGNGTQGSDLLWAGPSDAIRVRTRGPVPRDLELVLIDPNAAASTTSTAARDGLALAAYQADPTGTTTSGATAGPTDGASASTLTSTSASPTASASASAVAVTSAPAVPAYPLTSPPPFTMPAHHAPRPAINLRAAWGADESWRRDIPYYSDTLVQAHVHHTASANGYTRASVPGMIRGMYSYHTRTLGWNDIGYNFLVDRFGRIWEGRAGGIWQPVRGAHTLGFNDRSFGVAVIGNYQNRAPSRYAVTAVVRLIAWKLDLYGRRPAGWVAVTSEGSDRYPAGAVVGLPVVDGHRDTNLTACPGGYLYGKLGEIRRRAQRRADYY
jgi:uncharacterized protein with LGFP repeats